MDIKNCRGCGKMFSYLSGPQICPECRKKDEDDFTKVKKYLYDHPGASMKEISDECEVSIEKITRYLKDGRLEIKEGSNVILECESCGKAIRSGRLCRDCMKQLERDMGSAVKADLPQNKNDDDDDGTKHKGGMRYLKSE